MAYYIVEKYADQLTPQLSNAERSSVKRDLIIIIHWHEYISGCHWNDEIELASWHGMVIPPLNDNWSTNSSAPNSFRQDCSISDAFFRSTQVAQSRMHSINKPNKVTRYFRVTWAPPNFTSQVDNLYSYVLKLLNPLNPDNECMGDLWLLSSEDARQQKWVVG